MKKPFFAKFLEKQTETEETEDLKVQTDLKAGRPLTTLKYPSDRDEVVTMKYPSDDDEFVDI